MLPLEGIRVVELTTAWAGPMAGRVLAWYGAESIHIESPSRTNTWRSNRDRPNPVTYPDLDPGERPWDRCFTFNSQNVNKRSLVVDLKNPLGFSVVRRLIATADVLICNFRPGMLQRLGLDHATLSKDQPGLIVIEMPAFGLTGPDASYAALGPTMEMAAGMSAMIGYPGGQPTVTGPSYMDPIGGFNAAAAILTALHHRDRTGLGQHIEMAQVEGAMQFIGPELIAGVDIAPDGNHLPDMAPHNAYPAPGGDDWIAIAAPDDATWGKLARIIGGEALARRRPVRDADRAQGQRGRAGRADRRLVARAGSPRSRRAAAGRGHPGIGGRDRAGSRAIGLSPRARVLHAARPSDRRPARPSGPAVAFRDRARIRALLRRRGMARATPTCCTISSPCRKTRSTRSSRAVRSPTCRNPARDPYPARTSRSDRAARSPPALQGHQPRGCYGAGHGLSRRAPAGRVRLRPCHPTRSYRLGRGLAGTRDVHRCGSANRSTTATRSSCSASAVEEDADGLSATVTVSHAGTGEVVLDGTLGLAVRAPDPPPDLPVLPKHEPRVAIRPGAAPEGLLLGSDGFVLSPEVVTESLADFHETESLFAARGLVHSGCLIRAAMGDALGNLVLPMPVIFAGVEVAHLAPVPVGAACRTSARITRAWETRGKHFFETEEWVIADGRAVARHVRQNLYAMTERADGRSNSAGE